MVIEDLSDVTVRVDLVHTGHVPSRKFKNHRGQLSWTLLYIYGTMMVLHEDATPSASPYLLP